MLVVISLLRISSMYLLVYICCRVLNDITLLNNAYTRLIKHHEALVFVVAFTKKEKKTDTQAKEDRKAASRANTQPFSKYFSVRMRIILILYFESAKFLIFGKCFKKTTEYLIKLLF